MSGKLFIVPTPIGNLEDMSPRAIETLKKVDIILAEDTRTSSVLLRHFGIEKPLISHHKFNEHSSVKQMVERIVSGETIALISDAGTPGISDPGFLLSRECRRHNLPIETLPGPNALVPALVDSGLPCDRFVFEGFLPQKSGRQTRLKEIAQRDITTVLYESPLRLVRTLAALADYCGTDRPASVSREISKIHEETVRGSFAEIIEYYEQNPPKGEIVIVIGGKDSDKIEKVHKNKFKQ